MFDMAHAVHCLPDSFNSGIEDRNIRLSLFLLNRAFHAYENDVHALVERGVRESTQEYGQEPRLSGERLDSLQRWRSIDKHSLGYDHSAHTHLVRAVVAGAAQIGNGLPSSRESPKPITWFAEQLLSVTNSDSSTVKAPFINKGAGLHVMRAALTKIRSLFSVPGNQTDDKLLVDLLVKAADYRKIMHIPWSKDPRPGPGRPPTVVVHDCWINLGKQDNSGARSRDRDLITPRMRRDLDASRSSQNIMLTDCRAPWSANQVVSNLHKILNRTSLPTEWNLKKASLPQVRNYVTETYEWVSQHYDGSRPLHQTAILAAIIFSKLLPNVCHEQSSYSSTSRVTELQITRAVQDAKWTAHPKRTKGFKDPIPFIIMMTVFIIGLYEPETALRQQINAHKCLGPAWTDKHGIYTIHYCLGHCSHVFRS